MAIRGDLLSSEKDQRGEKEWSEDDITNGGEKVFAAAAAYDEEDANI